MPVADPTTTAVKTVVGNKELLGKGLDFLQTYWRGLEEPIKKQALNYLTTTAADAVGVRGISVDSSRFTTPQARERAASAPYQEQYTVVDDSGKESVRTGYNQRWSKSAEEIPQWTANVPGAGWAFENPRQASDIAGSLGAGAITTGGGWLLEKFANAGSRPSSAYSAPVEPYRGGYNSSVESAEASAFYKHQLEEQKYRHKMELMQAREQSRIPGIQNTSVGAYGGGPMDNSSITGLLTNQFGNTRKYF